MNLRILLFGGLLLALPCIASAKSGYVDHDYSVECETHDETECTVKSNKTIKSVRVEFLSHKAHSQSGFVKKEFEGCPTEVSIDFDASPKAKFFIQTCDGSSGVKVIGL
ncbi:MAG: hypothetical protein SD837_01965 [Candidatus Electrothrix scaldis]|jgi:hypothetical protein|nr:MAG: hypothetical protein SD837_01965 [Candidatus Electrothrix sp. GW3-3]